jgi:hypothetical protein
MINIEELTEEQWGLIREHQLAYQKLSYAYEKLEASVELLEEIPSEPLQIEENDISVPDNLRLCMESIYREMEYLQIKSSQILKVRI